MASHYKIHITGVVQGVGFRPFVYTLACSLNIVGTVYNNAAGVVIECSCSKACLDVLVEGLQEQTPVAATIAHLAVTSVFCSSPPNHFSIAPSRKEGESRIYISPDLALCNTCHGELFAPDNHRYHHPFINCTDCGSRYSIINDTPYDRGVTSMAEFAMCEQCATQYEHPVDRRFHAEPVCCPECGPECRLLRLPESCSYPLADVGSLFNRGLVGAVKGCGGFQICCDASHDAAIVKVRDFKNRPAQPFAVMARSLAAIHRLCYVSDAEEALLVSSASPIVLLRQKRYHLVSAQICMGQSHIGVMLPTTGLHHLLFHYADLSYLLMTSANRSGQPLITSTTYLLQELGSLLDFCIDHNRHISNRIDDSVAMVVDSTQRMIRRARGYVPQPIPVPLDVSGVLALGGQQKNCFAMGRGQEAFMGPHIGTLGYLETNQFLTESIAQYQALLQLSYTHIVHDLHPTYETTRIAPSFGGQTLAVQHHHAHHASCMAENGLNEPCLGLILDGSGYGVDGTIWGGELLLADFNGYERLFHLDQVPMPGGEKAVQYPFRMGLAYLAMFLSEDELRAYYKDDPEFQAVYSFLLHGTHLLTSSCGRLFDGVASLLGCVQEVSFEGQGAMLVEGLAERSVCTDQYTEVLGLEIRRTIPSVALMQAVYQDVCAKVPCADISRKFLNSLGALLLQAAILARESSGVNRVVFSGGVFQNRILALDCKQQFSRAGFECFSQNHVPCNDGGLALGQLCIGAAQCG